LTEKGAIFCVRYSQNYKLTPAPSENCFAIFLLRVHSKKCKVYFGNVLSCSVVSFAFRTSTLVEHLFKKVFIWFLGQPVVWSEPNISQIEAWSYAIYAWYQEFKFDFFFDFF
jgi:hypothetical protein